MTMHILLQLIIVLLILGAIFYVINRVIPLDAVWRNVLNIVLGIIVVIWLLSLLMGVQVFGRL